MSLLVEIALKTTALFLCASVVLAVMRSRSAAVRHRVLALTFAGAIAAPTVIVLTPVWYMPLPSAWMAASFGSSLTFTSSPAPSSQVVSSTAALITPVAARPLFASTEIVGGIWLGGCVIGLSTVVAGMWRVRRMGRRARPLEDGAWRRCADEIAREYGLTRHVQLLHSAHPTMLVTWGLLQPRILIPAAALQWSEDRIRIVLWHELAHVMRWDWPVLIAAGLLRAVHWFNPLVWIAYRRMRQESEQASDDLVLQRGIAAPDYASHLLAVARDSVRHRHAASAAIAIAHPSTLEGRVRAMLNARANRTPLSSVGRWSAALVAAAATVIIAGAGVSTFAAPVAVVRTGAIAQVTTGVPTLAPASQSRPAAAASMRTLNSESSANASPRGVEVEAAPQVSPGTITGVLYDQLGGLMPGVAVALVQRPDGARYETVTDRNGAFTFSVLPAGDYELSTSLPGFANVTNFINVRAGTTIDRSITLPMGTLQETIVVTGGDSPSTAPRPQPAQRPRQTPEARTFFSGGIGGQIRVPSKLVHVNPIYPANVGQTSDVVVLTGRVGIDGFLADLREVQPAPLATKSSHPSFVASAIEAASQWQFTPTLLNNVPVEANITIRIDYTWR